VPEKLKKAERAPLLDRCDLALREAIDALAPRAIIAVGTFAEACSKRVAPADLPIHRILHPSPASPAANKGWAERVEPVLLAAGASWPTARGRH